ncbi:MAG: hypothetical protein JSS82_07415 [Bacteroidetes bacterium]|nr:hypothetical protein [Bacteroidota bacterium]
MKITVTTTEKSVPVARMIVCLCNTKDSPDLQRFESDVLYDASVLLIGALGVTKMIVGNVRHIAFHNYMFPLTILDWMEMSNGTRCKPWYQNFPVVEAVTEEGALIVPDSVPEFGYNNYSTIVGGSNELSHVKGVLFTDSAMRFFTKKEWHYNKADVEGRTLIQYLELVMTMHPTAFCNCYSIVDTVLCVESTLKSTNFELVLRNDPVDDGGLLY